MNKLYEVMERNDDIYINEYDIKEKYYDTDGWHYLLKNTIIELSQNDLSYMTYAFSPKCALLKYIMLVQDGMFLYMREPESVLYWKNIIKEDLHRIKKAKKLLEKYL